MSSGDRRAALVGVAATALFLAVGVVGLGVVATDVTSAQSSDGDTPPELGGGEKINTTAVEVSLVDDTGLVLSTIDANDFLLSDGDLANVTAQRAGTNASVTLVLAEPIAASELTIGIASDSDISDINGTQIRTGGEAKTVTIPDMDGVPPRVLGTNTGDAIGGPAELEFRFDERLSNITVEVTGPENATLGIDDFDNPVSNRYVARYTPPVSGEYTVSLTSVTDRRGNTRNVTLIRGFTADRTEPEAVIGIDFGASGGVNITFDASQSVGNELTYEWDFGDGATETGQRVSHEFTPAEHTISLTVRNGFGNTDRDTVDLNLTGGLDSETDVDRDNETAAPVVLVNSEDARNSLVSVTGARAGERVKIGTISDSEPPLVSRNAVSLDRLAVTPTVDTSFSLALSGLGAGDISDAATGDTVEVGGFTVLTDLEENEVSTAEFVFSIDARRLDVLGTAPSDVVLRRESGGEWTTRNTTVLVDEGETYQFAAETPGFSRFAVVATNATTATDESEPGGENETDETNEINETAAIEVTDATVDPVEIAPGESVDVTAQVENTGGVSGTFRAGLERDGTVVETRETTVEPGASTTVEFTRTIAENGTVSFAVNGTTAGDVTVVEPDDNGSSGNTTPEDELNVNESAFTVANVTLSESSIGTGDSVRVDGDVINEGDEEADYIAELKVDGEVVDTFEVPAVPPGSDIPVTFTQRFNESGTYNVSIGPTASESQLEVGGGGGLFGFLGFLPLGLIQTGLAFVGVPLTVIYLVLKAVAFYLGY